MVKENGMLPNGRTEIARKLEPLKFLKEEDRNLISRFGKMVTLKRNVKLFEEGEPANRFFIILSGVLKLSKNSAEESTLIDLTQVGEIIGGALMIQPQIVPFPISAKAMIPCEMIELSYDFFKEHWSHQPHIGQQIMSQMAERVKRLQNDKKTQRMHLEQKLAYILTEKIAPIPHLRITRQDLADAVGSSNESVIRILSDWTKKKYISSRHQEIIIHDLDKLISMWK